MVGVFSECIALELSMNKSYGSRAQAPHLPTSQLHNTLISSSLLRFPFSKIILSRKGNLDYYPVCPFAISRHSNGLARDIYITYRTHTFDEFALFLTYCTCPGIEPRHAPQRTLNGFQRSEIVSQVRKVVICYCYAVFKKRNSALDSI